MYTIDFYDTADGKCPVEDFLKSLDDKMRAKSFRTIDLLENNGPELRELYSKALDDGIFELRVKQSSHTTRIFYFFFTGKKAILTIVKKTQKTPRAALRQAKKYRSDYIGGIVMTSYKDYKQRALQDSDFKAEYDKLQEEYDLIQELIDARKQQHLTQKELAMRNGITQADISRIEKGLRNPSLSTVKKWLKGLESK